MEPQEDTILDEFILRSILDPNAILKDFGYEDHNDLHILDYDELEYRHEATIIMKYISNLEKKETIYNIGNDISFIKVPQYKIPSFTGRVVLTIVYKFFCNKENISYKEFKDYITSFINNNKDIKHPVFYTSDGYPGLRLHAITPKIVSKRSLNTIWIPKEIKSKVVSQIESFFSQKEKDFYMKYGITHKLAYLFAGLPGTGKSSFVKALASHMDLPIYYLNIADPNILRNLSMIERDSFILIEDIDTAFRNMDGGPQGSIGPSISSFINALDGVHSPENVVIIMTCNDTKILDFPAIRRGRINHIVSFEKMNKECVKDMIFSYFPEANKEKVLQIVNKISQKSVIPSDLQEYILENRDSFEDFYNSLMNSYINSVTYFHNAHSHNKSINQRYYYPEGMPGIM